MLEPVFSARYWHAEAQLARSIEKLVERIAIILEAVSNERYELSFPDGFVLFFFVYRKYLFMASRLYLPHEFHARRNRAFYAV